MRIGYVYVYLLHTYCILIIFSVVFEAEGTNIQCVYISMLYTLYIRIIYFIIVYETYMSI